MSKMGKQKFTNNIKAIIIGLVVLVVGIIGAFVVAPTFSRDNNKQGGSTSQLSAVETIPASSVSNWEEVYTYTTSASGDVTITGLTSAYATLDGLVIPATIGGNPVTALGENAFGGNTYITYVHFDYNSQVTAIYASAFRSCTKLKTIELPDSLTRLDNAFRGTTSLISLTIPRNLTIWNSACSECTSLQNIYVDSRNPRFTSVDGVMYTKTMKTLFAYPQGRVGDYVVPEGVETINHYAFFGAKYLSAIKLPNTLKTIGSTNFVSTGLTELIIPDSVTSLGIYSCSSNGKLQFLKLSNSLTTLDTYACWNNTGLQTVVIPEGVTKIDSYAFNYCTKLANVVLPSTLTTLHPTAFTQTAITNIMRPASLPDDQVTGAFGGKAVTWYTPEEVFYYTTTVSGGTTYAQIGGLIPGKNLTALLVPATIGGYPVNKMNFDWSASNSVRTNYANVRAISFANREVRTNLITYFAASAQLDYIYLPNTVYSSVDSNLASSIGYVFIQKDHPQYSTNEDNTLLLNKDGTTLYGVGKKYKGNTLVIPDGVTKMGYCALNSLPSNIEFIEGLERLTHVTKGSTDDVIFVAGTGIKKLTIPSGYLNIWGGGDASTVASYVSSCSSLTSITYAEGITVLQLAVCVAENLTSVSLPSTLTLIKSGAFRYVSKLTKVVIPSGCVVEEGAFPANVTLVYQDDMTDTTPFKYTVSGGKVTITGFKDEYKDITSLVIPVNIAGYPVTTIGSTAFSNNRNIASITFAEGSQVTDIKASLYFTSITEITLPDNFVIPANSSRLDGRSLLNIYTTENNVNYTSVDGVLYSKDLTTLVRYPAGRTGSFTIPSHVTKLAHHCFKGTLVEEIILHSGIVEIGASAFEGAEKVQNIVIPRDMRLTTTDMSWFNNFSRFATPQAFANDVFEIPNGITKISSSATISFMGMDTIVFPASVTTISRSAIYNLPNLKNIIFLGDSITIEANAFRECPKLTTIVLPAGENNIAANAFPAGTTLVKADAIWNTTANGDGLTITGLTDEYKTLTTAIVPKSIGGKDILAIGAKAFYENNVIEAFGIASSSVCTSIGNNAFYNTGAMKYAYLSDSVKTLDTNSFYNSKVQLIYAPYITSISSNGGAFHTATKIREIYVSPDNTVFKVGSDGALYSKDGTKLYLTPKDRTGNYKLPEGVTEISGNAFSYASYTSYDLFNGSLKTIRNVSFEGIKASVIVIPDTVTYMIGTWIFNNAKNLKQVIIPDTVNIDGKYDMFYGCSGLETFKLPANTTTIHSNMFYGCTSLRQVLIPEGVTTIETGAFRNCSSLKNIHLPSTLTTISGSPFRNMSSLESITVAEGNENFVSVDGVLFSKDMTTLYRYPTLKSSTTYTIPDGVTTIKYDAFQGVRNVPNIVMPDSVTVVENRAFADSAQTIKNITLSPNITSIGAYGFSTSGISEMSIPSGVKVIDQYTFKNCNSITTVTLPEGIERIEKLAFENCTNLTTINLPSSITYIAPDAFKNCPKLKLTTIPSAWTEIPACAFEGNTGIEEIFIPNTVTKVGDAAFRNCTNLRKVTFEAGSPLTTVGNELFKGCTALTEITMPEALTEISTGMFHGCKSLENITLPTTVTTIRDNAFAYCSKLNNLTLHSGLSKINASAFLSCTALNNVVVPASVTTIGANAFQNCAGLTNITFVGTGALSIGNQAFIGTKLVNVDFGTRSVNLGDKVFQGLTTLNKVLGSGIAKIGDYCFDGCKWLLSIDLSNCIVIGQYGFQNCVELRNINSLANVQQLGTYAFSGCTKLTGTIDLSSVTNLTGARHFASTAITGVVLGEGITTIATGMFYHCVSLTDVTFPSTLIAINSSAFDGAGLTNLELGGNIKTISSYAFYGNAALTSVVLGDQVTSLGDYAFTSCSALTTVVLGTGITQINNRVFYQCSALSDLTIKGELTSIGDYAFANTSISKFNFGSSLVEIRQYAFSQSKLTSIDLSQCTNLEFIGGASFYLCYLISVKMPSASDKLAYMGDIAFYSARFNTLTINITTAPAGRVVGPSNFISSVAIRNTSTDNTTHSLVRTFDGVKSLRNVYLDKGLDTYNGKMFANCTNLTNIYIGGAIGTYGRTAPVAFADFATATTGITGRLASINVYVAPADVDAYKADANWSKFNILSNATTATVTFKSAVGIVPEAQVVPVGLGTVSAPADLVDPNGATFKGYYMYYPNNEYVPWEKITDWNDLLILEDTTIYALWDNAGTATDMANLYTYQLNTDGTKYYITGYTDELMKYTDIIIPSTYNGKPVVQISENAFKGARWITSVDFEEPSNITAIDNSAFQWTNLSTFTIPHSVTYMGGYVFNQSKVNTIIFRNAQISTIMSRVNNIFGSAYDITTFILQDCPDYVLHEGVIYSADMKTLYLAPAKMPIDNLVIPNSVTTIGPYAFYCLNNSTSVIIPEDNVITYIGSYGCFGIKFEGNVTLRDVTYLGRYSFFSTDWISENATFSLTSDKLTTVGDTVLNYSNMRHIIIDCPNLTTGLSFSSCSNLISLYCRTKATSLANNALKNCSNLEVAKIYGITNHYSTFQASLPKLRELWLDKYFAAGTDPFSGLTTTGENATKIIVDRTYYAEWQANANGYNMYSMPLYYTPVNVTYVDDMAGTNEVRTYDALSYADEITPVDDSKFNGWYYFNAGRYMPFDFSQQLSQDVTLYAFYNVAFEDLFEYQLNADYTATITGFNWQSYNGTPLTIPDRITRDGHEYVITAIGAGAFAGITNLNEVTFPNTIKDIGNEAFRDSTLSEMTFEGNLNSIGEYAFAATHLGELDSTTHVPSTLSIGKGAFSDNYYLCEVYIAEGVTAISDYMFAITGQYDNNLCNVIVPSTLTSIGEYAFAKHRQFYQISCGEVDAQIDLATLLHNVTITSTITNHSILPDSLISIGAHAFEYTNLGVVTGASRLQTIGDYAFRDSWLDYIDLPATLTSIGNSAFAFDHLREVTLGYGTQLGTYVFRNNSHLEYVDMSSGGRDSIPDGTFHNCHSLMTIYTGEGITYVGEHAFYMCHNLTHLYYDKTMTDRNSFVDVTYIGKEAFVDCWNLISGNDYFELLNIETLGEGAFKNSSIDEVYFGPKLQVIPAYAFQNCTELYLVEFTVSQDDMGNDIGVNAIHAHAFEGCTTLHSIQLPSTLMLINGYAFSKSGIDSITIPAMTEDIGEYVFAGCPNLTSIDVEVGNANYISHDGILFYTENGWALNSLVAYPAGKNNVGGVSEIDLTKDIMFTTTETIWKGAFAFDPYLVKVCLPNSVTLIDEGAFERATKLTTVEMPATLTYLDNTAPVIRSHAFGGCDSLTVIKLTNSLDVSTGVVPTFTGDTFAQFDSAANKWLDTLKTDITVYVRTENLKMFKNSAWGMFNVVGYTGDISIVTVVLENNGGTGITSVPVIAGNKLVIGSNPIRHGFTFDGWYDVDGIKWNFDTPVTSNMTLYASWIAIDYYIHYNLNGADTAEGTTVTGQDVYDVTYDYTMLIDTDGSYLHMGLIDVTRVGYQFMGWYRTSTFASEVIKYISYDTMSYREANGEPITLYARWEKLTFTMTFEVTEGYEASVLSDYNNPVDYDGTIRFTYVFGEGYDQNYNNLELTLAFEVDGAAADIPYTSVREDNRTYFTIEHVKNNITISLLGVNINTYTINFAPNTPAHASDLANMPSSITVQHGQTMSLATDYSLQVYGWYGPTVSEPIPFIKYIKELMNLNLQDAKAVYDDYLTAERTVDNPYTFATYTTYDEWFTAYNKAIELLDTTYTEVRDSGLAIVFNGLDSISTPTANGYTFRSWNLTTYDPETGEVLIVPAPFDMNTPITSDITLSATWNVVEYTIVLHLNGGSLGANDGETAEIHYTADNDFMLPYNTDTIKQLTRAGYSFGGWYASADFTGDVIESIAAGNYGNREYWAKWDVVNYTITYHLNDGTFPSTYTLDSYMTYTIEDEFTLPVPVRTGYEFAGWFTDSTFSGNQLNFISRGTTGNIIVYAKWVANDYVINYHLGGNAISQVVVLGNVVSHANNMWQAPYTYSEVDDLQLIDDISRTGYTFLGWFDGTGDSANAVHYLSAGTTGNVELYAKWEAKTYTIELVYGLDVADINGGETLPTTFTFTFEDMIATGSVAITPNALTHPTYHFVGWFDGDNHVTNISTGNYTIRRLVAKWSESQFNLYLSTNDTAFADTIGDIVRLVGQEGDINTLYGGRLRFMLFYSNKAYSASPVAVSYRMNADLSNLDASPVVNLVAGDDGFYTIGNVEGHVKVYVDGLTLNTYTVQLLNSDGSVAMPSVNVTHGETLATLASPTRTNYTFVGWYLDSALTSSYNLASAVTSDLTLYAKWQASEYTLTIVNNVNSYTTTRTFTTDNPCVLNTAPWDITGYELAGFSMGGGAVTATFSTSALTGDATVTAMYNPIEYTITYAVEGGTADSGNPTSYTIVSPALTLKGASREGYTFQYWTDQNNNRISVIASGSYGNLVLTAHFVLTSSQYVEVTYYDGYTRLTAMAVYKGEGEATLDPTTYNAPDKAGYTFTQGDWYTDIDLTNKFDFTTRLTSSINLYAKYELVQYNITYTYLVPDKITPDKNLDSSDVYNINSDTYNVTTTFLLSAPSAVGYNFDGWYLDDQLITTLEGQTGDLSLVAHFSYIEYHIIYELDTAIAEQNAGNPETFVIDSSTITLYAPTVTDTNYVFLHWANTLNTTEQVLSIASGTTRDVYLTAMFKLKEQYASVNLYIDGSYSKTLRVLVNSPMTNPSDQFTRVGYRLDDYWYTDAEYTDKYNFATTISGDLTLYNRWVEQRYNIQYIYTVAGATIPTMPTIYSINSSIVLPELTAPSGYRFDGWYLDVTITSVASGDIYDYTNARKITAIYGMTGDLVLVAKFDLMQYTISYDLDGGSLDGTLPSNFNIKDSAIDLSQYVPTKEGYNFVGWLIMQGADYVELTGNTIDTSVAGNVFIKANFEFIPTHATLTRYVDGEMYLSDVVALGTPFEDKFPVIEGYQFDGWYANSDCTGDKVTTITEDTIVYGRTTPVTYYITYNSNVTATLPTNPATYDVTSSFELGTPDSPFGYYFDGWYTGVVTGDNGEYNFDNATKISGISKLSGDLNVVAKFNLVEYTISYNMGYGTNNPDNITTYTILTGKITLHNPTPNQGYTFVGWEWVDENQFVTEFDSSIARNITLYARYNAEADKSKDNSEFVVIAISVGATLAFFGVLTYSIVGSFRKRRLADAKRIEELLQQLNGTSPRDTNTTPGYRDDFKM